MKFDIMTKCCFCGANNEKGVVGYAGERTCPTCKKGGYGEPDEKQMAYKFSSVIELEG
jgi:hypothetical protein